MKHVVVKQGVAKKVGGKELVKSVRQVADTKEPIGFKGTLANGLKFIVKRGSVLLF